MSDGDPGPEQGVPLAAPRIFGCGARTRGLAVVRHADELPTRMSCQWLPAMR